MKINKKIIVTIMIVLAIILSYFSIFKSNNKNEVNNIIDNEITDITEVDEQSTETQEVEDESFELQGDIAYNGDTNSNWEIAINGSASLTYVSQINSEWRYYSYTSTQNASQNIGNSGCGVACATMVIDNYIGQADIREVADTFIANGYRSANNGTYWSAYRALADNYNITYQETSNLDTAISLLEKGYTIVCSCGNGLFTSNGHYIYIYGYENGTLKIYDPYLYSGKFDTSTRSGKVTVDGNTVYCSVDNFRNYANYSHFFCYYSDKETSNIAVDTSYTRYVKVNTYLNVRDNINGSITDKLYNGTQVTVYETSGDWSRIGDNRWVCSSYLTTKYSAITTTTNSNILGLYKVTASLLNVRSGASTNYKIKRTYKYGTRFDTYEIENNWAKTPSGWVCLDYCTLIKKY